MKYDFGSAVKAKTGGSFLSAEIKDATFKGVDFTQVTSQKTGDTYNTLSLKVDIDGYGEYVQNFFEPQSDERQEMQWGLSASPLDHFLIIVREILEAVNPQIIDDIDKGKVKLTGTFKQIVNTVKTLTSPFIGTPVQIKLIPQNNGFAAMPSFVARITKSGDLGISTWIIGHDLTMTPQELKKIEAAKEAAPTNMATKANVSDVLSDMENNLESEDDSDDLPF